MNYRGIIEVLLRLGSLWAGRLLPRSGPQCLPPFYTLLSQILWQLRESSLFSRNHHVKFSFEFLRSLTKTWRPCAQGQKWHIKLYNVTSILYPELLSLI